MFTGKRFREVNNDRFKGNSDVYRIQYNYLRTCLCISESSSAVFGCITSDTFCRRCHRHRGTGTSVGAVYQSAHIHLSRNTYLASACRFHQCRLFPHKNFVGNRDSAYGSTAYRYRIGRQIVALRSNISVQKPHPGVSRMEIGNMKKRDEVFNLCFALSVWVWSILRCIPSGRKVMILLNHL